MIARPDPIALTQVWSAETVVGLESGQFRSGTALASSGRGVIYALAGGRYEDADRRAFLAYDQSAKVWQHLASTPHAQGAGDALAWCGRTGLLYAFVGSARHNGAHSYFLSYDPASDTWAELGGPWRTTDDGAALAWAGDEYIYALRGEYEEDNPRGDFAPFDVMTGAWEYLPDLPTTGGVGDGGSLLCLGQWETTKSGSLIALAGNSALEEPGYDVFSYSVSDAKWKSQGKLPCPVGFYVGNRLAYAGGCVYYWQGSPTSGRCVCGGRGFYSMCSE